MEAGEGRKGQKHLPRLVQRAREQPARRAVHHHPHHLLQQLLGAARLDAARVEREVRRRRRRRGRVGAARAHAAPTPALGATAATATATAATAAADVDSVHEHRVALDLEGLAHEADVVGDQRVELRDLVAVEDLGQRRKRQLCARQYAVAASTATANDSTAAAKDSAAAAGGGAAAVEERLGGKGLEQPRDNVGGVGGRRRHRRALAPPERRAPLALDARRRRVLLLDGRGARARAHRRQLGRLLVAEPARLPERRAAPPRVVAPPAPAEAAREARGRRPLLGELAPRATAAEGGLRRRQLWCCRPARSWTPLRGCPAPRPSHGT